MDNADLEKLKLSQGKLLPKFKASVTSYSVTVGSDITEIKLTPLTADGGASYTIKGANASKVVQLTEGKTVEVEIVVTAEDGKSNKTYSILMRRLSADDATLAQLDVSAGWLNPSFSPLVTSYDCYLPCGVDALSLRVKTQDPKMSVAMSDGTPVGTVQLNPGRTPVELCVRSASGKNTSTYTVTVLKNRLPPTLRLKEEEEGYECAVCCGVVHQPSRALGGPVIYCRGCLEDMTRTNKIDPFTGAKLDKEGWMQPDLACEEELAKKVAVCVAHSGEIEGPMQQIGSKLLAERIKASKVEEPTEACPDCSKKVPILDVALHKNLICSAKHTVTLSKTEVKARPWEKRLVDESCGSDVKDLLQKAKQWESKYIQNLPKPGEAPHRLQGPSPLDCLQTAARCYGTALKCSPRSLEAHIGLGLVMEEFFYAEDFFGLQKETPVEASEGEAEISSKEEEFLAICQLHGVPASAPLALQLKAVEAEYHSLKEAGQSHKAEHVQQLHAWKSKKVLQASQGSYAVDTESPLFLAKLKFEDSCSINSSDAAACFHMGRLCLLLGQREDAVRYLKAALAQKPMLSAARFCMGLALGPEHSSYAKPLLSYGLLQYLTQIQELHETQADISSNTLKEMHSQVFYRSTNTLIVEGFQQLAKLGGSESLSSSSCLHCAMSCLPEASIAHRASTYQQLLRAGLKARASLLSLLHKAGKTGATLRHCQQLSALITHSGLESSPQLRTMQMEVFQLGVELLPSSSEALCHLGNGQLAEYEATEDGGWLGEAELSFRASISSEGAPISHDTVPEQLSQQKWWKKKKEKKSESAAPQKTTSSAATKPAVQKAPQKGGPSAAASRQPPSKSVGVAKQGAQAAAGRGGASQPAGRKSTGPAVSRQPARATGAAGKGTGVPAPRGGQGSRAPPKAGTGGKSVATLGELKTGAKKPAGTATSPAANKESVKPTGPVGATSTPTPAVTATATTAAQKSPTKLQLNKKSYLPRLGLARTLRATGSQEKIEESCGLYEEVISMTPDLHDAYIELGEMLSKTNPVAAVDAYGRFPFSDPPTFNDAYLHGEIVRLLMASENYDNPRLLVSLVAMGRALGIGVLEKQVSILENKFKTALLKKVYSGVHGKPLDDPDLQAFFKFKCWP